MARNEWTIELYSQRLKLQFQPRALSAAEAEDTGDVLDARSLIFRLTTQFHLPEVQVTIADIHQRLTGRSLPLLRQSDYSPFERAGQEQEARLRETLELGVSSGRLSIKRVKEPQVHILLPELPAVSPAMMPRDTVEELLSNFEVRFIDDGGEAMSGLELTFTCRGKTETLATDGDGVAQFNGYEGGFGRLTVKDPGQLAKIMEPRLDKIRAKVIVDGKFVPMFLREQLDSVQLESFRQTLVVVGPEPGHIFVDIFDKTGQFSHNLIDYEITGPMSFSGTTSELGQIQHPDVIAGDYTLKFTLEYPEKLERSQMMAHVLSVRCALMPRVFFTRPHSHSHVQSLITHCSGYLFLAGALKNGASKLHSLSRLANNKNHQLLRASTLPMLRSNKGGLSTAMSD
jgi:hypothetical protein